MSGWFGCNGVMDGQGADIEWQGFGIEALFLVDRGDVLQGDGDIRMVRTQNRLVDFQAALEERERQVVVSLAAVERGQVVEAFRRFRVLFAEGFFADGQGALEERLGAGEVTFAEVPLGEVVGRGRSVEVVRPPWTFLLELENLLRHRHGFIESSRLL